MAIDFIKRKPRSKQNFWASWNSDTRNLYVGDVVNNMDNLSLTIVPHHSFIHSLFQTDADEY